MNKKDKSEQELQLELEKLREAYASLQTLYEKGLEDRRFAEEELTVTERRFRQVAESAGEWIWEVDANGLYTYSNPVVEDILGYSPEEIVGKKHFYELFYGESREETKLKALEVFASRQSLKDFENQNVHKNGKVVWLSTTGSPILDGKGKLLGYQGVDTNITERREVEEALRESEYFFKESQKAAFIGSYKTDFLKGTWDSSEVLDQIFGIDDAYERTIAGWLKLVHPAEREMMSNYLQREVIGKALPFDKEYRIVRHNDGQIRWVHGLGQAAFDEEGNVLSLIGTIQDISQRKFDEEEIEKLNYALEATGEVVYMTDKKGIFTYVNPAFSKVYGYQPGEVIGKVTPRVLQGGHAGESTYKHFWSELLNKRAVKGEWVNKTRDGRFINIDATTNAIVNQGGETIGFIAIQKDITFRKKIEKELVLAKEKAEESDRLKSAFLANMSHEIRTPMNGIVGFTNLLSMDDVKPDEQQKYIRSIEKSSARLFNIINEIIDISKIESGQMELYTVDVNINEQLDLAYDLLKPEAELKDITLSCHKGLSGREAIISTDKSKLYSIITNLLKNAIKYTDHGSVELGYSRKGDFLEFYVRDTGVGIPENRLGAIFERFIQSDIAVLQARQGAGLGLSIAKAFAEMLGGDIWVNSVVGKGSIFYFTLPHERLREATPAKDGDFSSASALPEKKLKILITEDDETSEMLTSVFVEEYSDKVFFAKTGKEAIETYRNNPDIDLILMDIQMPEMDGYEATRQIRNFDSDIIIIAQTAYGIMGDRQKAIDAGCNDYISKPINRGNLSELIGKYFTA